MYNKAYGVIETLAPLHVGATAGEETGNLNLIFRDQFTQTGIIPGSSIRGRLRSQMRLERQQWLAEELKKQGETIPKTFSWKNQKGKEEPCTKLVWLEHKAQELQIKVPSNKDENLWYGHEAIKGEADSTTESLVKFEYASILWLPVFCPGQPIVWVSCPRLLKRYKRITGNTITADVPDEEELYISSQKLDRQKVFFNFGFVTIDYPKQNLTDWFPDQKERPAVVVKDKDIAMIHDMALYRQSRVTLEKEEKRVEEGKFFNTEALPEETILVFPIAYKPDQEGNQWQPFTSTDIYLGGLESIGFGHCELTIKGV
ncbi:MAG: type III-B CRISPR module RAMP protein Cmr4 [Symploca sp. SIO2G7]|nr:type III-B CRISPR module RAMP protein Cmr4 [Symploca sp. SIO2G7]